MVPVAEFAGRKVGVLGLARSGRAAVEALKAGGAEVLAWDDNEKARAAVDFPLTEKVHVTGTEAHRAWRGLLRRFGHRAPGPRADLFVPPSPRELLDVPTWDWHRLGVDGKRQRAVRAAASLAQRLEECAAMPPADAMARLRVVPGVGEWTAAETLLRAIGHPDAVSVGDFHLANAVVHALTGRARGTDEQMLALLAPWTGQRARIVRLIELSGARPPAFGPRFAPTDIRAI